MTGQCHRGVVHPDGVERLRDMRVGLVRKDIRYLVIPDAIQLALQFRRDAAVKVAGDRLDVRDADVVRQQVVDALPKAAWFDRDRYVRMCTLAAGVDARIRPPGPFDADDGPEHL